jgi:hypothetical protein
MTAHAKKRGHPIIYSGKWKYAEGPQRGKYGRERPCTHCHAVSRDYDVCLGQLEGVATACCGHGQVDDAYIVFDTGEELRGEDVWKLRCIWIDNLMTPSQVIAVYLLVKNLDKTRCLCELSRHGYKLKEILQCGEVWRAEIHAN